MAFSPTDINGLQLWLRADAGTFNDAAKTQPCADGDAVATWADQSGNGYDFTQTAANSRPKYNAIDANVECELNNTAVQFMTAHAAFPINQQSFSFFFIGSNVSLRDSWNGSVAQPFHVIVARPTNGFNLHYASGTPFGNPTAGLRKLQVFDGAWKFSTQVVPESLSLLGLTGGTSAASLVVNGQATAVAALPAATYTGGWTILGADAATWALLGGCKQVLAYNRPLNATEVGQIWSYARTLGAVPLTAPNVLALDGDSITAVAAAALNRGWVRRVFGSRVEVLQYNFGLGAVTLASLASQASTVVDPLYDGARRSVLVIFAGTNDVALGGTPGATVYNTLASYCNARRAVGWKVCVVTMLPRTGTNTERATYNSLIRANWPSFADALADVGGDATIGQDGQNTNTTYYNADAIHPNSACHAILANYIRAATGKLLLPPARSPLMTGGRLTPFGVLNGGRL